METVPFGRAAGIVLRAGLMALVVALPQRLGVPLPEAALPVLALFAILAAALTASEYASPAPSLVAFRGAAPVNRLRWATLAATVAATSLAVTGRGTLGGLLAALGARAADLVEGPLSPLGPLLAALPGEEARAAAGLALPLALGGVAALALALRRGWPRQGAPVNLWVALPRFDPGAGDVGRRLRRDAQVNLLLALLLPVLMPWALALGGGPAGPAPLGPAALTWTVTAWAFLPANHLMRAFALAHLARAVESARAARGLAALAA